MFSNTSANLVKRTMCAKTCQLKMNDFKVLKVMYIRRLFAFLRVVIIKHFLQIMSPFLRSYETNFESLSYKEKSISFVKSLVRFAFDVRTLMLRLTNLIISFEVFYSIFFCTCEVIIVSIVEQIILFCCNITIFMMNTVSFPKINCSTKLWSIRFPIYAFMVKSLTSLVKTQLVFSYKNGTKNSTNGPFPLHRVRSSFDSYTITK